jgi:hypothetical protein
LWPLELPFVNVLRSLIPYKWFNTTSTTFMIVTNAQIDWTFIIMSPNIKMFVIVDYFMHPIYLFL